MTVSPIEPLAEALPQGVLRSSRLDALRGQHLWSEMGRYAAAFRARHVARVPLDPFRQWSRGWEYPFALDALLRELPATEPRTVLEAGSGFTFFPFLLSQLRPAARITCVDGDPAHEASFREAAGEAAGEVTFRQGFLESLPDPDGAYDAVTCISVLEHVDEPAPVLREMRRVLRPGGLLVLTFDIALDGDYQIPLASAERVLDELAAIFPGVTLPDRGALAATVRAPDTYTTRDAVRRDPSSMPWSSPLMSTLGSIRHGFLPRSFGYRRLTVWSGALR
jgi:SAM-dependent methyltransferase